MKSTSTIRLSALILAIALSSAHAADITLGSGTYTGTQTYNNGVIGTGNGNTVTFGSGANYTFDTLSVSLAWNRVILNSGATLNVGGNLSVDVSGVSLNGGTLTAGGLLLHDSPNWDGTINDGKQSIEKGDSIINGSTIIANQSNPNFISFFDSRPDWHVLNNNLWIGSDGATINSNGHNVGVTMAMGNFSNQAGSLTKAGAGTLTLSNGNSYTGGTTVEGGVLEVTGSSAGNSNIRGSVTVNNRAELRYTGGDGTGFGFNDGKKLDTINVAGGLVNSQGNMTHLWGATVNMTGGELRVNNGNSDPSSYQRFEWNQSTVNTFATSGTATISGRINLRSDGSYSSAVFNVADGDAATDLLVSAAITQSGSVGLTKNGAGTMEMSGSNSYTGTTTVNAGTLQVDSPFFADSSTVVIASGAKINLNHNSTDIVGSLVIGGVTVPSGSYNASHPIYGASFAGNGSLVVGAPGPQVSGTWIASSNGNWSDSANWDSGNVANGADNAATFSPGAPVNITVDGNRYIGILAFTGFDTTLSGTDTLNLFNTSFSPAQVNVSNGVTATLSTNIAGTSGIEKTGPGTLVFTGTKSYSGDTVVSVGTLELSGATAGNAQIHGSLTVNSGATVAITDGDGTGFGFYNNPVNSITVDGGTIDAISGSHIGFGASMSMTLNHGGNLSGNWYWNGDSQLSFSSLGDSTNSISGGLMLRSDSGVNHTFTVDDGSAAIDLQVNADLTEASEFSFLPASAVIKSGAGTMILNGDNTYRGNTFINNGELGVGSDGSLRFYPTTNGTSNFVTGSPSGLLIFLGTIDIDFSAASATVGNRWNLFNLTNFTEFAPTLSPVAVTSSLGNFTEVSPGNWELAVSGAKWVFSTANGDLSYLAAASPYATWGFSYGLSDGSENEDLDNDGLTNFQEYAFGLAADSGSSVDPIIVPLDKTTGTFSYTRRLQSLTGLSYTVWTSTDLVNWTQDIGAVQDAAISSEDIETVDVTLTQSLLTNPALFIQVRAQ